MGAWNQDHRKAAGKRPFSATQLLQFRNVVFHFFCRRVSVAVQLLQRNFPKIASRLLFWETDFYPPQVLGGAALFDNSAAAVYKNHEPWGP